MWPIRSALFVPAHRRDWVGKAIRVSPGAAVLDIEDSSPPNSSRRPWPTSATKSPNCAKPASAPSSASTRCRTAPGKKSPPR